MCNIKKKTQETVSLDNCVKLFISKEKNVLAETEDM